MFNSSAINHRRPALIVILGLLLLALGTNVSASEEQGDAAGWEVVSAPVAQLDQAGDKATPRAGGNTIDRLRPLTGEDEPDEGPIEVIIDLLVNVWEGAIAFAF